MENPVNISKNSETESRVVVVTSGKGVLEKQLQQQI